jgi:pimeloyl-ACP methyl ester carboxylesterase
MTSIPPPGRLVDIGGRRLHLYELGKGSPIVVLESGIAASSLNWRTVQAGIAKFTRVISYDRAGLGWSDPAPAAITLDRLVADLRALLEAAGAPAPYVLVGHSFGGLIVRAFAARHPKETVALVLVDALGPEEWSPLSPEKRRTLDRGVKLSRRGARLASMGVVGWCLRSLLAGSRWMPKMAGRVASGRGLAVMSRLGGEVAKMPREVWPMVADHWSQPKSFLGMAAHLEALPEAARTMRAAPPLGDVPVIALTPAGSAPLPPMSANFRQIAATESGHWIHLDEPELLVAAVREFVQARRSPA